MKNKGHLYRILLRICILLVILADIVFVCTKSFKHDVKKQEESITDTTPVLDVDDGITSVSGDLSTEAEQTSLTEETEKEEPEVGETDKEEPEVAETEKEESEVAETNPASEQDEKIKKDDSKERSFWSKVTKLILRSKVKTEAKEGAVKSDAKIESNNGEGEGTGE